MNLGELPVSRKKKERVLYVYRYHIKYYIFSIFLRYVYRIKVSTFEVCKVILFSANLQDNRLEIVGADKEKKLTETFLQVRVFRPLIGDSITDTIIVAVYGDPLPSPAGAPDSGRHDEDKEFLDMNGDIFVTEPEGEPPAEVLASRPVPRPPAHRCSITEDMERNCSGDEELNTIKGGEEGKPPKKIFLDTV